MPTIEKKGFSSLITALVLIVVFFGLLALVNFGTGSYIQRIVIGLGISIILVVSLNLSNGFTGVFSLGHVGFMAIGAYISSILTLSLGTKATNLPDLPSWLAHVQLPFIPALLIAGLVAAGIAFLIGIPLM